MIAMIRPINYWRAMSKSKDARSITIGIISGLIFYVLINYGPYPGSWAQLLYVVFVGVLIGLYLKFMSNK
jgi:hypothetical protein